MGDRPNRSLFWPVALIGIGVVWLLGTLGVIPNANFASLASLWPLLLVVIGLDILIGRRSAAGGALVGLIAVALVVFFLIAGPALGLTTSGTLKTEVLSSEMGTATVADITLDFSSQPVTIDALTDKTSLLKGEIDYYGTLNYSESGDKTRRIRLERSGNSGITFDWDPNARWDIGLTPNLPIDLTIDGGSGSSDLDLSELRLISFTIDQGSGSLEMQLPASTQPYRANITGGSGSMNIAFPSDGDITVRLDGGSGSINLDIPKGTAVSLEVRSAGSGSVNLPDWLLADKVYGDGKEGTWKTAGFDQAAHKLTIICDDLGSGSFKVE
ncbi:MAG: LiaI-LiaF-like domain-containing protein [Bellilinea sp.]